jgi:Protein of unknown function (DUF3489)
MEQLWAAQLSGERLLELWNALPGVEQQTKIGDRDMLTDRIGRRSRSCPTRTNPSDAKRPSKRPAVTAVLQPPKGATVDGVASAMGWQRHTVLGLFSETLRRKLGLTLA